MLAPKRFHQTGHIDNYRSTNYRIAERQIGKDLFVGRLTELHRWVCKMGLKWVYRHRRIRKLAEFDFLGNY